MKTRAARRESGRLRQLTADHVCRAIAIYLVHAYPDGPIPERKRPFAALERDTPLESIWSLAGVERLAAQDPNAERGYALRIGNAWYPHMKLLVQPYATTPGYCFAVDTHDQITLPPSAPDQEGLRVLQANNQRVADAIHAHWEREGLPTQRGLLRAFLRAERAHVPRESDP